MIKRSKFNVGKDASSRTFDGIVFDSAVEMNYYRDVVLPAVKEGSILNYELQKKYELVPKFKHEGKTVLPIIYKADFYIVYSDGREEVIDIKGFADQTAKLKRKLFWHRYPDINYLWVGYSKLDGGWVSYETIQDGRKERKRQKAEIKEIKDEKN